VSAPKLAIGHIVAGKYAIHSLLLHGGPTATYHAITAPNRDVALKLYDPALSQFPTVTTTLQRYQTTTDKLPGHLVIPILERGEDPGTGAPYTVTDYYATPSLAQLVELCPLSTTEMLAVIRNLTRILDLAHRAGMSHLSLKPTNLFVGPGPANEVRVCDFGMSLVRKALPDPTLAGLFVPWLAPEQTKDTATPGTAADVFASALLGFYAVTGKSYWRSCAGSAVDVSAWEREIAGDRVSVVERAAELGVSLPPELRGPFARALALQPSERFTRAGEFADALAVALGEPAAPPAPEGPRAEPKKLGRATMLGLGEGPPSGTAQPPQSVAPSRRGGTMMGLGNALSARPPGAAPLAGGASPGSVVPPPPPQVEAALNAFETAAPPLSVRPELRKTETARQPPPAAAAEEVIDIPGVRSGKKRSAWPVIGLLAVIIAVAAGVFTLRGPKALLMRWTAKFRGPPPVAAPAVIPVPVPEPASSQPVLAAEPPPILSASAAPEAPLVPPPSPAAEPSSQVAAASALPAEETAPPTASSLAPSAAPLVPGVKGAHPPASPAKPPPAPRPPKKPCGKFLKRCT
jgi:serine/threonine protein kinase